MNDTRARLGGIVAIGVFVIAGTMGVAAQDWKAPALASFDLVWQTIFDSFHDPSFGGIDWTSVKRELRPKAQVAASPDDARQVIRDMLARLRRSHFALLSASDRRALPGHAMVPIEIRAIGEEIVITRVTPDSNASRAGLRPGDRIVRIGTSGTASWTWERRGGAGVPDVPPVPDVPDVPAVPSSLWERAFHDLHGVTGSVARLDVVDSAGHSRVVDVARVAEAGEAVTIGNLPLLHVRVESSEERSPRGLRIGMIRFNLWLPAIGDPVADAVDRFRNADGLVIDLRGNPGGLADMMRGIAGHLLATPDLIGRMHVRAADLEFRANPRRSTTDGRAVEPFAGPVALLVDELTASTSECFAGGLQSLGRVRVFGTLTRGEALPAMTRDLPTGDVLIYAIGDFTTATGRTLEGAGVVPDEVVPLTAPALAAGRDPAADAALAWFDRLQASRSR